MLNEWLLEWRHFYGARIDFFSGEHCEEYLQKFVTLFGSDALMPVQINVWVNKKNCQEQVEGMRAFQTVKVNAGKDGQWSAPQRQSLHDILLTLSEQNACPFTPSQAGPTFSSAVWASAAAFMQSAAWTRFASEAWSHHRSRCVICLSLVLQISRFQGSQTSRMMSDDAHKNASCAYPYFRAGPSRSLASIGSRIQTHGSKERYLLGQLRHISMAWSDCGSIPQPAQVQPRFVCRCK